MEGFPWPKCTAACPEPCSSELCCESVQGCGCSPEQPALAHPAWSREVGSDHPQRSCGSVILGTFIKKFQGNFQITSFL